MIASRRALGALLFGSLLALPAAAEPLEPLQVYRSASCGCCGDWIDYLRREGFEVREQLSDQMAEIKRKLGVPADAASCHTAVVNGRFIEGHVPAREVRWLLEADASVRGVSVPGMPLGSPGMEIEGYSAQPYSVLVVMEGGKIRELARYDRP